LDRCREIDKVVIDAGADRRFEEAGPDRGSDLGWSYRTLEVLRGSVGECDSRHGVESMGRGSGDRKTRFRRVGERPRPMRNVRCLNDSTRAGRSSPLRGRSEGRARASLRRLERRPWDPGFGSGGPAGSGQLPQLIGKALRSVDPCVSEIADPRRAASREPMHAPSSGTRPYAWAIAFLLVQLSPHVLWTQDVRDGETEASSPSEVAARVDVLLAELHKEAKIDPAPRAADVEWLRRAYRALAGRTPRPEEVERFVEDS